MTSIFINQREFQSYILNFVSSEKYKEILENMINGNDEKFQQGFIQGLCWASLLTSQINNFYADIPQSQVKEKEVINDSNSEAGTGTKDSSSEA